MISLADHWSLHDLVTAPHAYPRFLNNFQINASLFSWDWIPCFDVCVVGPDPQSCGTTNGFLHLVLIKPFPTAESANECGYAKSGSRDRKDGLQSNHVRIKDDGDLQGREFLTYLCCANSKNHRWRGSGQILDEFLDHLIVESTLYCRYEERATDGDEDYERLVDELEMAIRT